MRGVTDLAEWLLACIAEDEAGADRVHDIGCATWVHDWMCDCGIPAQVLAGCVANRAIVEQARDSLASRMDPVLADEFALEEQLAIEQGVWDQVLRLLAQPFADRPDFDPEWSPQ